MQKNLPAGVCTAWALTSSVCLALGTPAPVPDEGQEHALTDGGERADAPHFGPPPPLVGAGEAAAPTVALDGGGPAATPRDAPAHELAGPAPTKRTVHGFRMGYLYIANYTRPLDYADSECAGCSLQQRYELRSPHQFLLGYEVTTRIVGHDWLNVILVGNAMVSGMEQSKFLPSANFLVGFEVDELFQIGVGSNLTFEKEKPLHMVVAAGWTPRAGSFQVPIHAFLIPDVDGNHRMGMTFGVNW